MDIPKVSISPLHKNWAIKLPVVEKEAVELEGIGEKTPTTQRRQDAARTSNKLGRVIILQR